MASYISDELIDRISERADIVEIISHYLPLKKAGKNYKALCPFHQEKTPSFMVSPEKQLFHCFGCGAGGNVFNFVMKWEKISFPEAVKMIGEKVGISVAVINEEAGRGVLKEELYRTNERVADLFQQELKRMVSVKKYLKQRGFIPEVIDKFRVGWAPTSGDFLKMARAKGISLENLKKLSLLIPSQKRDGWYAWFRQRLIFPIFTPEGRICGFGGRILDDGLPKYLNSSSSLIFDKSRILYGLNFSKEAIRQEEEVILVEGYTDVMTLHQRGIKNVVASLGTSLTSSQARLIKRYTGHVFIAYDQDKAGISATLRGIDLLLEVNLEIRIISMPHGVDPADLVNREGEGSFLKRKDEALAYFDYRLNLEIQKRPSLRREDKIEIIEEVFPTLAKVSNSITLGELIRSLSQRLDLDEEMIRTEFKRFKRKERGFLSRPEFLKMEDGQEKRERMLLQLMLDDEAVVELVEERWDLDNFTNPDYRRIAKEIIISWKKGKTSFSRLINQLEEENLSSIISSFSLSESPFKTDDEEKLALDLIDKWQRNKVQKRISELTKNIKESQRKGQEEKINQWWNELTHLKRQISLR
ncbi:DNA primase [Candidatus Aerophobetes bacterium]|uniref:DNA primase n=3 Tax=root TaxID=1 RepID=A0A523YRU2_UNCAE|nr:MAG: DNA primase [Candidatus Aerophobetes bacterium]